MQMKKIIILLLFLFSKATFLFAQSEIEMADVMRGNGKIYVVIGVICLIFTCLAIYLFVIDRKVSGLEKIVRNRDLIK